MPRIPFGPDNPGNVNGRPKGSMNKATKLRNQLLECLPEVLAVLKAQALSGDPAAIKLLLDKTMPNLKPVTAPAALPITSTTPDDQAADLIYQAGVDGDLDPDHAASLLHLIGSRRQLETEIAHETEQQQIAEIRSKLFSSAGEQTNGQSSKA